MSYRSRIFIVFVSLSDFLQQQSQPIQTAHLQQWLEQTTAQLQHHFIQTQNIRQTLSEQSHIIDQLVCYLWQHHQLEQENLALFAVGGYGRQEMFPFSDVDMMVFAKQAFSPEQEQKISAFIAHLWDIKTLKPAVSVRTLDEALSASSQDISIATTLLETRLIIGNADLAHFPRKIIAQTWSEPDFFTAKQQEQKQRYTQYHSSASYVEPDIKNSPGGLRDIHQIAWLAKRHFRVNQLCELTDLGFISQQEYLQLQQSENFLWKIRYHLHLMTQRDENRLLFDYQKDLAQTFGYLQHDEAPKNFAVESFMKQYYLAAQQISTLNEMLTTYFYESVIAPRLDNYHRDIIDINQHFKLVDGKIAVQHHKVFTENPSCILELFHLWASNEQISGIRARTLRLLRQASQHINDNFRKNPQHQTIFLNILRCHPQRLYPILLTMKRYDILKQYIPAFNHITGLMQYDLFHMYTVDAHTLFLIHYFNHFSSEQFAKQFPIVSTVYHQLPRYDLLLLATIFHDIAKGRNGEHEILGAEDAYVFCKEQGLSETDSQFVAWLIRHHLLMSITAQKKDISDPDVVQNFAQQMPSQRHLDYLYCLTVADINATNPKLWNTWRGMLLRQLYLESKAILQTGQQDHAIDYQQLIDDTQKTALATLSQQFSTEQIYALWQELGDDYFIKESVNEIVWHTQAILQHQNLTEPLVLIRKHPTADQSDMVQIFIYTPNQNNLFAKITNVLDRMDLNVVNAKILTADKDFSLDTFVVLDHFKTLISEESRQYEVIQALKDVLNQPHIKQLNVKQRRLPRELKHFKVNTQIKVHNNENLQQNEIDIITLDQPGLLAKVGQVFMQCQLEIHSARIVTFGERAEDKFFVSKGNGQMLNSEEIKYFTETLKSALDT